MLIANCAVVAALGAFRSDTPRVSTRPWLIAALLGTAAMQLAWVVPARALWWVFDAAGWWFFALLAGAVFVAVFGRRVEPHIRAARLSCLACCAATVALVRISSTVDLSRWLAPAAGDEKLLLYLGMTQLVVTSVICIGAIVATALAVSRLPAVKYGVVEAS